MKIPVLLLSLGLGVNLAASAQWVQQPLQFSNPLYLPLHLRVVNASTVWADGIDPTGVNFGREVARTIDGGAQWSVFAVNLLPAGTEGINHLTAISATTAWVCTGKQGGGGRVLRTTDGGQSWVDQTNPGQFAVRSSWPNTIYFFNANDGVVLGDPDKQRPGLEIYTTANGGTTWTRVANVPEGTANELGGFFPPAVVGTAIWVANDSGDVLRSTDKGQTWQVARKVGPRQLTGLAFRDAQNGLAVMPATTGTAHTLYRTTDGGASWAPVSYSGPLHGLALRAVPGTGTYLSVGSNFGNGDQGSSFSRDNGQTWQPIESSINHLYADVNSPTVAWSGRYLPATAQADGVNRFTSSILGSRGPALVAGASLSPNPSADGKFMVRWAAATHQGSLTLTVTDALGRQVLRRVASSAAAEASLDLGRAAAGVYQVRLQSDAGVSWLRAQVQ